MANAFYGDRWYIDTPSNNPITLQSIFVKHVRWSAAAATAGQEARITDTMSPLRVRWDKFAVTTVVAYDDSIENWWFEGFTVPVLQAGFLIIDLK